LIQADRPALSGPTAMPLQRGRTPLIVLQDALTLQHRQEIIDFTIQRRLPGMFVAREWVASGGLMSYGENLAEMYRRGAYFVDKILRGANQLTSPSNRSLSLN
jgi:hypothetical protein